MAFEQMYSVLKRAPVFPEFQRNKFISAAPGRVSFIYQGNFIVKVIKTYKSSMCNTLPTIVNNLLKMLTWWNNLEPDLLLMRIFFEELKNLKEYKSSL